MIKISLLVIIPAVFSCASGNKAVSNETFSEFQDRHWYLTEVKKMSAVISIDRSDISMTIYTVRFLTDRLFGAAADNSYFARYTTGENHALSIGRIASSRVAPLYEMKDFTEYEYFQLLERVDRWEFRDGKLELHTYDENRAEVTLIYS